MLSRRSKKKNPLPWNGYHPASKFIFDEIAAVCVTPDMKSISVHSNYKDTVKSFKLNGIEYSYTFASLLSDLWKIVARDSS